MKRIFYCLLIVFFASACRDRYDIPLTSPPTGYLVVEGIISYGGPTTIRLSRSSALGQVSLVPEKNASVLVEGDDNAVFPLSESDSGHYVAPMLALNLSQKYRVRIKTENNKDYISDFRPVINTPEIDSLSWSREQKGVEISVHAHDPQNDTRYYKWDYEETWEFKSRYMSNLKFTKTGEIINGTEVMIVTDDVPEAVMKSLYTCWQSQNSSSIKIGTTTKLAADVVNLPINFIDNGDWRLSYLYSINVIQYGISAEAYEFYEKMKKNTESVGSIFDAQPSEIKGNVQCVTDPTEAVIGFIEVCSSHKKRFFISNADIGDWQYYYPCDYRDSIQNVGAQFDASRSSWKFPVKELADYDSLPFAPVYLFGSLFAFSAAPVDCIDCRLRGTSERPSFWP